MICPKCNQNNENGAQYCRNCGSKLPDYFPELFPTMSLVPASQYNDKKSNAYWWALVIPCALICLVAIGVAVNEFITASDSQFYSADHILAGSILTIVAIVAFFICRKAYKRTKGYDFTLYDYVQEDISKQYVFVVKNRRFGLYNTITQTQCLDCRYDTIDWLRYGTALLVSEANESFVIDIYGNKLK